MGYRRKNRHADRSPQVTVPEEAFRRLVLLPVFKTGVTRDPGQAGSIPVRLRKMLPTVTGGVRVTDPRRQVPRTDVVMADPRLAGALARLGCTAVKHTVAAAQERVRLGAIDPQEVVAAAVATLLDQSSGLRPVINATGVVLHTNLGSSGQTHPGGTGGDTAPAALPDLGGLARRPGGFAGPSRAARRSDRRRRLRGRGHAVRCCGRWWRCTGSIATVVGRHPARAIRPALRRAEKPVLGRVQKGRLLLDLRCVHPDQDELLHKAVTALAG